MGAALDRCTASLGNPNVMAFLRVIREGESSQDNSAYTIVNGGGHFEAPPWKHPFYGVPTTQGAKASGAYQFLGTTWARVDELLGLGGDFSPASQDVGAVYLIEGRGALKAVMDGNLVLACSKLAPEWVSLPGLGLERVQRVFQAYGGASGAAPVPPPVVDTPPDVPATLPEKPMGALALLQLFGPILSGMIPQIKPLLTPGVDKNAKFAGIAQVVLDTINQATGAPNLQASIEAMQTDPAAKKAAQQAIVSHPDIIESMTIGEVGGGVAAARTADLAARAAPEGPFWKTSAVFYVSCLLVPMVLWYVGSSIAGGIDIPVDWPWYAQMPLKLLGKAWDDGARVGLANLVVGMVLGGICGVYFGVSVTQAKQSAQQTAESKT